MTGRRSTRDEAASTRGELLRGTLDMLILRTLLWGPVHGHGISVSIERASDDALKIDHGSLYPALQRLIQQGWIVGEWGTSENNRRAKFYRLTAAGRKQLHAESSNWNRLVEAISRVLDPAREEP